MSVIGFEEGATCGRDGCTGVIAMRPPENCSCHIAPPCSSCTAPRCFCPECGWEEADDVSVYTMNDFVVKEDRKTGVFRSWEPRPLDPTKVDWRSRGHSNSSMIKEGVYPQSGNDHADREMVHKLVDGTFGGRFESFGNGRFKFIAYTD